MTSDRRRLNQLTAHLLDDVDLDAVKEGRDVDPPALGDLAVDLDFLQTNLDAGRYWGRGRRRSLVRAELLAQVEEVLVASRQLGQTATTERLAEIAVILRARTTTSRNR